MVKNQWSWMERLFPSPCHPAIPPWGRSFPDISFGGWNCKQLALVLAHVGELSGFETLPLRCFQKPCLATTELQFSDHREVKYQTTKERKWSPACKVKQVRQSCYPSVTCSELFLFDLKIIPQCHRVSEADMQAHSRSLHKPTWPPLSWTPPSFPIC